MSTSVVTDTEITCFDDAFNGGGSWQWREVEVAVPIRQFYKRNVKSSTKVIQVLGYSEVYCVSVC